MSKSSTSDNVYEVESVVDHRINEEVSKKRTTLNNNLRMAFVLIACVYMCGTLLFRVPLCIM